MVYITGTTKREYVIDGVALPKKAYSAQEIELGRSNVLEVNDITYAKLGANQVFRDLVKEGQIVVSDKPPAAALSPVESQKKITEVQLTNQHLMYDLEALQKKLEAKMTEMEDLKAEALAEISKRDKEIESLKELIES